MVEREEQEKNNKSNQEVDRLRKQAVYNLTAYLETPNERRLREYQVGVTESLRDYFEGGETAGYIDLPTGSGKSHVALEIIEVLGMRSIILSPTKTILRQNERVAKKYTDLDIRNYYSAKKDDISGGIVNTSYQSAPNLIKNGEVKPEDVELLVCDELHTSLGEQRHTLYRQFPNALMIGFTATPYYQQLEGYIQRGIVDPTERWTSLFKKKIHEMTLEEGMELGILTQLDVHLMRTYAQVDDIELRGSGDARDYTRTSLERFFNTEARNYLAIGLIAGRDKIPSHIRLSTDQFEDIERIHELIKGKRTAIFGLSVDHIEALGRELRKRRISAEAIHYKVPEDLREDLLDLHSTGDIQVLLGVDALRLGWDSPSTEVGIYLAPTRSGIVAVQELGRILRPSPDTGKRVAIAIQTVDKFMKKGQAPVLIPNIFNPYYVLRGTQTGREITKAYKPSDKGERPIVTFSGMGIDTIIEEARSSEMLRLRFKQADLAEMGEIVDSIIEKIYRKNPSIRPLDFYGQIVEELPYFIPREKQEEVIQGLASIDSNTVSIARKFVVLVNMKTIINAVEKFFTLNRDDNEELIDGVVTSLFDEISRIKFSQHLTTSIYNMAERAAAELIAQKENMPVGLILSRKHKAIKNAVDELLKDTNHELTDKVINFNAERLSEKFNIQPGYIRAYIHYRNSLDTGNIQIQDEDDIVNMIQARMDLENINELMIKVGLTPREQVVLGMCYGLNRYGIYKYDYDDTFMVDQDIAEELGFSNQRVNQILIAAENKLRKGYYKNKGAHVKEKDMTRIPFLARFPIRNIYKDKHLKDLFMLSSDSIVFLDRSHLSKVSELMYLTEYKLRRLTANRQDIFIQILSTIKALYY